MGPVLRARQQISAAFLAALWLCGPLLAVLHGLERQHAYCAEHGAFEERGGGHEDHDAGAQLLAGSSTDGAEHEGCAFSPFAAGVARPHTAALPAVQAPALPPLGLPALAAVAPLHPIAILAVAPKSSPPAVA